MFAVETAEVVPVRRQLFRPLLTSGTQKGPWSTRPSSWLNGGQQAIRQISQLGDPGVSRAVRSLRYVQWSLTLVSS